jgi:putative ATPase
VFHFEPLSEDDIVGVLKRAIADKERGLGKYEIEAEDKALKYLATVCDGDARKALNALEVGVLSQKTVKKVKFDLQTAKDSIQGKTIDYDGTGDTHYDLASAFQKSMRGSDPDATVYWLARMIAGGEDVRFIARRIAVCAAEDVGNADPIATVLAASAVQISEFVGLPEAQLALAQAAIYVACAPKSNASSSAIWTAVGDVQNEKTVAVPKHLKDSHYSAAKKMGFGAEYKYPHSFEGGFVVQDYLPGDIKKKYYKPSERGYEKNIRGYLQKLEILIKDSKAKGIERPNGAG